MPRPFTDPAQPWRTGSPRMKELLGLPASAKLPVEGMPSRMIDGILVWVAPLPDRQAGQRFRRMTHRVRASCPRCAKAMSAGRLFQHRCMTTNHGG